MTKLFSLIICLLSITFVYSCYTRKQKYSSFNILYYKEYPIYNNKGILYEGKNYFLQLATCYKQGTLQNLDIYKSEGPISYTKQDLEKDKLLMEYVGVPLYRKIMINGDSITDNGIVTFYKKKGDSIFVHRANELTIYVFP